MAIVKCLNGHHYDNSKFDSCPHCKNKNIHEIDRDITVNFDYIDPDDYDKTRAFDIENGTPLDDEKTIGAFSFERGTNLITGWIVCVKGPAKGRDYRLYHGWNRIGRGVSMDVYIPDDKNISEDNHAGIVFDERTSQFFIVNQSGALTYLNGESLFDNEELLTGDRIKMGDSEFIFIAFCTEERRWEEE